MQTLTLSNTTWKDSNLVKLEKVICFCIEDQERRKRMGSSIFRAGRVSKITNEKVLFGELKSPLSMKIFYIREIWIAIVNGILKKSQNRRTEFL